MRPKAEGGEELQLRELTATVEALRKEVEASRAAEDKNAPQIQEMRVEMGSLKACVDTGIMINMGSYLPPGLRGTPARR